MEVRGNWRFWIDRGGTFTDVVAVGPDGNVTVRKLLSEDPERYDDAAVQGIRDVLGLTPEELIPEGAVGSVRMGTTVGTNALLERRGEPTVLVITKGFGDALRIGYQDRPRLFDLHIVKPEVLYERVIEVDERLDAKGEVLKELDPGHIRDALVSAHEEGYRSVAIAFMHGYRYPDHELEVSRIARDVGFTQISTSHDVSPTMRLVSRAGTAVADAYTTPLIRRYVVGVQSGIAGTPADVDLKFMQSNGGLTDAVSFRGRDSLLSGPAGGVIGAVAAGSIAGVERIISFDMGGTSTDVAHYAGELERTAEVEVGGVVLRVPMMSIKTVAAGGGSLLHFDGMRFRVGPDSAGADPGPACYRRDGPLTVTDANVMLGRIQPDHFPRVFGPERDLSIDVDVVRNGFEELAADVSRSAGRDVHPEDVAEGFLEVAVQNMARAILKISVHRGHDIEGYALCCFGGAGGQHACRVADAIGVGKVIIHPLAGVLSAYGIGLADVRDIRETPIEAPLDERSVKNAVSGMDRLSREGRAALAEQGVPVKDIHVVRKVNVRYAGTDTPFAVAAETVEGIRVSFISTHRSLFGFVMDRPLVISSVTVEAVGPTTPPEGVIWARTAVDTEPDAVSMYVNGHMVEVPLYRREGLSPGYNVSGPAIVIEETGTNVIDPGWTASIDGQGILTMTRTVAVGGPAGTTAPRLAIPDPVRLEVFNNLFMSVAEQMGETLRRTAHSVNIKERLDFSCAVFDGEGRLVANAPHIPVHLGSMGECVRSLVEHVGTPGPGEVYLVNSPYGGGTHLPDITIIKPVYPEGEAGNADGPAAPQFYVASRGHHADIGGLTPGSMPPDGRTLDDEGVHTDGLLVVRDGRLREEELVQWLTSGKYPARSPGTNIADVQAQIAANEHGASALALMSERYSLPTMKAYMDFVRENASESVRRLLATLRGGSASAVLDDGDEVVVNITVDRRIRKATIDLTGTSPQRADNFNAPLPVTTAAVLYVLRTLVDDEIPLNAGCLEPIDIIVPEGSMLNPDPPAAVAAGNVETSQHLVDALLRAVGALAGSHGTMNNLAFGNDEHQYYETICGGAGAGPTFGGADAVHSHMTNTRITDPEVIEWRHPVIVEEFSIRAGSGGGGKFRGGDGAVRRIRFLEPMTATIVSSHRTAPPLGLDGGGDGSPGTNTVVRADGEVETLKGCDRADMEPGDTLVIETPGGGGFGEE